MGRASREQAAHNRGRVVAVASDLFRAKGVENVTLAEVMDAAGLTVGAFYKQFDSREALVSEAFALAFEHAATAWKEVRECSADDASGELAALARHYFRKRPAERNCPLLAFSSEACQLPRDGEAATTYADGVAALFDQFKAAASRGAACAGVAGLPEADVLVRFAAMIGAGLLTQTIGSTAWTRKLQSAVVGAMSEAPRGDRATAKLRDPGPKRRQPRVTRPPRKTT